MKCHFHFSLILHVFWAKVTWTVIDDWNAIPNGKYTTVSNFKDCEKDCESTKGCTMLSWNIKSHHCYLSNGTVWSGLPNERVTSACQADKVKNCGIQPSVPIRWMTAQPDPKKPLGGYSQIPYEWNSEVFHATKETGLGTYNHNVMIDYLNGRFFMLWKNCQVDEDCNGQRILYSQSINGRNWTAPQVMFPNMTTAKLAATLEPGPPIHLNGRLYAASSPGIHNTTHDSSAQGSQFCLWPDPVDPRNCGPPSKVAVQYNHTLLMRAIHPGKLGDIGSLFWASKHPPALFAEATAKLGIKTLSEMDTQTQKDISILSATEETIPCNPSDGTLKCEFCEGGCQVYSSIDFSLDIANERAHWVVPSGNADVILYRSHAHKLYASIRTGKKTRRLVQSDANKYTK